jgi:hypothetical protein
MEKRQKRCSQIFLPQKYNTCKKILKTSKKEQEQKLKDSCHGKTIVAKQYRTQWSQRNFILSQFLTNVSLPIKIIEKPYHSAITWPALEFTTCTYPFNRPISFKLPFKTILGGLIIRKKFDEINTFWVTKASYEICYFHGNHKCLDDAETYKSCNKECFVWVASGIGITLWVIYKIKNDTEIKNNDNYLHYLKEKEWQCGFRINLHFWSSSATLAAPCSSLLWRILAFFSAYCTVHVILNWEMGKKDATIKYNVQCCEDRLHTKHSIDWIGEESLRKKCNNAFIN